MDGDADKGYTNEQEGSEDVMNSLNRWVASPYVEGNYILCITPTGVSESQRRCEKWMRPTYSS